MKSDLLLDAIGEARDAYILDAHTAVQKKMKPWIKWGAIAACLFAAAAFAAGHIHIKQTQTSVCDILEQAGLEAQSVDDPDFIYYQELPAVSQNGLLEILQRHSVVQGTIESISCAAVQDGESTWYITAVNLAVEEVLRGEVASDKIRIVSAAVLSDPFDYPVSPLLQNCHEGMQAVFVLREADASASWTIAGKSIAVSSLGDSLLIMCLERNGDTLLYQDHVIAISELVKDNNNTAN